MLNFLRNIDLSQGKAIPASRGKLIDRTKQNPNWLHLADGAGVAAGDAVADMIDAMIMDNNPGEAHGPGGKRLCPGCIDTVVINAVIELAKRDGVDVADMLRSLAETARHAAVMSRIMGIPADELKQH